MSAVARKNIFKEYYKLTKPGIVYANVFTTLAAFLFAQLYVQHFAWLVFVASIFGIAFVIASACVFNNYLDRTIDKKMSRTQNRALVTGAISIRGALIFATVLLLAGLAMLLYVNILTALIALFGFFMYVVVYGIAKRANEWGTVVGSVSGAVPIVVGYTAVTGQLDMVAGLLFLILAAWQMPHFYAIATYRLEEYQAANIPVLTSTKGMRIAKMHIMFYITLYIILTVFLAFFIGHTFSLARYVYVFSVGVFGSVWFWKGIKGFRVSGEAEKKWAKEVFFLSLIVLVSFCITLMGLPLLRL